MGNNRNIWDTGFTFPSQKHLCNKANKELKLVGSKYHNGLQSFMTEFESRIIIIYYDATIRVRTVKSLEDNTRYDISMMMCIRY